MTIEKAASPPCRARPSGRFEEQRRPGRSPLILAAVIVCWRLCAALFARRVPATPLPGDRAAAGPNYRTGSQGLAVKAATVGHDPIPWWRPRTRCACRCPDDGQAHHYVYARRQSPGVLCQQSGDGVVRAAFNACDVCFLEHKGYTQDGDEMVCNNCGRRFPADQINVQQGGCNPSPLERSVSGEELIIQFEDLLTGQDLF